MAGENSLKKRDVTLNPLSEEWMRRKPSPFGEKFLGSPRRRERPSYEAGSSKKVEPLRINDLGLSAKKGREDVLRESLPQGREEAKARIFVVVVPNEPLSREEILEAYLERMRKKDMENFTSDMGTLSKYAGVLDKLVGGRVYAI